MKSTKGRRANPMEIIAALDKIHRRCIDSHICMLEADKLCRKGEPEYDEAGMSRRCEEVSKTFIFAHKGREDLHTTACDKKNFERGVEKMIKREWNLPSDGKILIHNKMEDGYPYHTRCPRAKESQRT